jgi:hypothetical protein
MMVSTGVTTTDGTVKTSQKLGMSQATPIVEATASTLRFTGLSSGSTAIPMVAVQGKSLSVDINGNVILVGDPTCATQHPTTYTSTTYPGCDSPDIVLGGQVWAACNAGAFSRFDGTRLGKTDFPASTENNQ